MQEVAAELDRRFDFKDNGKSVDEFVAQVEDCFANGLRRIEAEGTFGRGQERQQIVLNLLMGDQGDEDRIRFAEKVNPPEAIKMFKQDLEAARRLRR